MFLASRTSRNHGVMLTLLISVWGCGFVSHSWSQEVQTGKIQDEERKLLEGLRNRRLFDLAEDHGQSLLNAPNITPVRQAELTIELIKTQTARALLAKEADRESAFSKAIGTGQTFLQNNPGHDREFIIRVQIAICHLAHGRLIRQELAAEMIPMEARDKAMSELRSAKTQLSELQREVTKKIPDQRNRSLRSSELTADQLMSLNRNIRLQLAIVNMNRAQLYPKEDQLNRKEALNQVIQSVAEIQRETSAGQPLWWQSRILETECLRLSGAFDAAAKVIQRLASSIENQAVPQSLLEQQLQLGAEINNRDLIIDALQSGERIADREPSLDLARLAAVISMVNLSSANEKQKWLAQAATMTRRMEQQHGAYWGRRAELMLIRSSAANSAISNANKDPSSSPPTATELDLMIRLADQAMRKQRWEDARKAYNSAAEMARQMGDAERMFHLALRTGQTFEKQSNHQEAAEWMIGLANRNPELKTASAAHLRGCWNWAQATRKDPSKQLQFNQFLAEHLSTWPNSQTADQARIWLAGQLQQSARWKDAFETYAQVSTESTLFVDAIRRSVLCGKKWTSEASPDQKSQVIESVRNQLEQTYRSIPDWKNSKYESLLALADFGLSFGSINSSQLTLPLEQLVNQSKDPNQQRLGQAWLLVCLASDPINQQRTTELIQSLSRRPELLENADKGLALIAQNQSGEKRSKLNQLRLEMLDQVDQSLLNNQQKKSWLSRRAEVLSDLGQLDEAIVILNQLAKDEPGNARFQLQIARLTTRQSASATALSKWRVLAAKLRPHSSGWYEAKYNIANLLFQMDKKDDAKKLLEYIRAIPPGWEQSKFKPAFEKLLRRCGQ